MCGARHCYIALLRECSGDDGEEEKRSLAKPGSKLVNSEPFDGRLNAVHWRDPNHAM